MSLRIIIIYNIIILYIIIKVCRTQLNKLFICSFACKHYTYKTENAPSSTPTVRLKIAHSRSHLPNNFAKTTTRASHAPKSTVFLRSAAANHLSRRITSRTSPEPHSEHFPKRESCILNHEGNAFRTTRRDKPPNTPRFPHFLRLYALQPLRLKDTAQCISKASQQANSAPRQRALFKE